jgi:hypothetical protein
VVAVTTSFLKPRPLINSTNLVYHSISLDSMGDSLESDILSTLDALVAEGVIVSGPYEAIDCEEEDYPVRTRGKVTKTVLTTQKRRCNSEFVQRS